YKFYYNKNKFIGVNILTFLGVSINSIFVAMILTTLFMEFYPNLYFDIDLLILILIGFSIIYIYMTQKIFIILNTALFEQFTYSFLGVSNSFSECCLEVNDEYIKIYNENIEHLFFYKNIKKVKIAKGFINFKYNKEIIIIPINDKKDNETLTKLKYNLSK
ncbi:hypothetical protein L0O91_15380, partial [Clostridium perfringens]